MVVSPKHAEFEGGAFADGSDMGVTGIGLQLELLRLVTSSKYRTGGCHGSDWM